jgi:hypothetical protein
MRVLLEMKQQIYWQEQDQNIRSQDLNQPVASESELPKDRSRTGSTKITSNDLNSQLDSNRQRDSYQDPLQENKGSVEVKQGPVIMDSRTIYRTMSFKGKPFQIGTDGRSHL